MLTSSMDGPCPLLQRAVWNHGDGRCKFISLAPSKVIRQARESSVLQGSPAQSSLPSSNGSGGSSNGKGPASREGSGAPAAGLGAGEAARVAPPAALAAGMAAINLSSDGSNGGGGSSSSLSSCAMWTLDAWDAGRPERDAAMEGGSPGHLGAQRPAAAAGQVRIGNHPGRTGCCT